MPHRLTSATLLAFALIHPLAARAADVDWKVTLSSASSAIALPQLPAAPHAHQFSAAGLADGGNAALAFQLQQSDGPDGLWQQTGSGLLPFAELAVTGATGPGRTGAESGDVFRNLFYLSDSIGEGVRVFSATANDPGQSADAASRGLWQRRGVGNVEIARLDVDGILGPGLGADWRYVSFHHVDSSDDIDMRALPGRRVLFAGRIAGPGQTLGSDGLSVHQPDQGNRPCMLAGSLDPELAPNVAGLGAFSSISPLFAVSPTGDVYARAGAGGETGVWQFCAGAPRPTVLTGVTGDLGPGMSTDTAVFGGEPNGLRTFFAPSTPAAFYFSSGGRLSTVSGAPRFFGLFRHDGTRNWPVVMESEEGAFGPQITGYVFNTATVPYNVRGAGKYALLTTTVSPIGNTSTSIPGLWRVAPDAPPEPVALAGDTGALAPAPGRTWGGTFYRAAIFDNGDIIVLASVTNPSVNSLWRLRRGEAPLEILAPGTAVQVPTPTGLVTAAVTSLDAEYLIGLPRPAGRDTWSSANGNILQQVTIAGYTSATTLVQAVAARPDFLFASGTD